MNGIFEIVRHDTDTTPILRKFPFVQNIGTSSYADMKNQWDLIRISVSYRAVLNGHCGVFNVLSLCVLVTYPIYIGLNEKQTKKKINKNKDKTKKVTQYGSTRCNDFYFYS